jgi:hypothetical protein
MQMAVKKIVKMLKVVLISSAATVFLLSGLMLCCQVGLVYAQQHQSTAASCCHASKTGHLMGPVSKSCSCCNITKDSPDQANKVFEITKPSGKSFYKIFLTVERFVHMSHHCASFSIAYQGPPRANASIPIYLQNSNLRL